jgi:histone H2A
MAPKKGGGEAGTRKTRSTEQVDGNGKAKKKSVSRAEKAGRVISVSKVHTHMLKRKQAKGVTRVSASAPVWITAAIEYFAAELLEQAGNLTVDPKQQGGSRKRITVEDLVKALRSDAELDKAMTGFRVLVGDKIKGKDITDALLTKDEKDAKTAKADAARAARAPAGGGDDE